MYKKIAFYLIIFGFFLPLSNIMASEIFEVKIILKEHRFIPEIIEVPADTKIRLVIENQDDTIEEFDSIDLKREKMIAGNSSAAIILAPLAAGEYQFCGEFNSETAKGKLVVK
jgi:hypothetical protein